MRKLKIPKTPYHIYSPQEGFSFGIDAVLLTEYGKMKKDKVLCEIGAGTGFISMAAYYKYGLRKVYGVEIQKENCNLFHKSVLENGLEGKVVPVCKNIKDFSLGQDSLDYVISNPPYYKEGSGLKNKDGQDYLSRYEVKMKLEDLFIFGKKNLKVGGVLYIIHRPHRLVDLLSQGRQHGLEPKEMVPVNSRVGQEAKMVLLKYIKGGKEGFKVKKAFSLYEGNEYCGEVKKFYEER